MTVGKGTESLVRQCVTVLDVNTAVAVGIFQSPDGVPFFGVFRPAGLGRRDSELVMDIYDQRGQKQNALAVSVPEWDEAMHLCHAKEVAKAQMAALLPAVAEKPSKAPKAPKAPKKTAKKKAGKKK